MSNISESGLNKKRSRRNESFFRADDYSYLPGFSQTRSEEVLNSIKEERIKDELNILFFNDSAVHKLTAQNGAKLDFNIQIETVSRNIRL